MNEVKKTSRDSRAAYRLMLGVFLLVTLAIGSLWWAAQTPEKQSPVKQPQGIPDKISSPETINTKTQPLSQSTSTRLGKNRLQPQRRGGQIHRRASNTHRRDKARTNVDAKTAPKGRGAYKEKSHDDPDADLAHNSLDAGLEDFGIADAYVPFPANRDGISSAVQSLLKDAESCYEGWVKTQPDSESMNGRLRVSFTIGGGESSEQSRVQELKVLRDDIEVPFLTGCLINLLETLRFERVTEDVKVIMPFTLQVKSRDTPNP